MSHSHQHGPVRYNRAFAIGVALNVAFVVIEGGYGVLVDSLALITDAGHNLSDVLGLLLAWGAAVAATKARSDRRTYGFRKATVMASLASAILLLVALGGITWEAVGRFRHPEPVEGITVIVVAGIGVVVNTITALLFAGGQKEDLNIRGAFLHMAADAGISLGVVVAGVVILLKGWLWVDPLVSLVIAAVIFVGTWGLLRDSINYSMDAVPRGIDVAAIREYLKGLDRVDRIHDLHVWPLSTTEIALTTHLVVTDKEIDNAFLRNTLTHLRDHFGIGHATIQVESIAGSSSCAMERNGCTGAAG